MSKSDRASLLASLRSVVESIGAVREEVSEGYAKVGRAMTRLSVLIATGATIEESLGRDWRVWALAQCKGFGANGADRAPPTVYRLRNAGVVANELGADKVGEASYLSLVPLYRVLADAAGKDDKAKNAASETVGKVWANASAKSRTGAPTEESVRTLVEASQPKGTRGAAGKNATQRKATTAAKNAAAKKNTPTAGNPAAEVVTIDPAAVESCGKVAGAMIAQYVKAGTPEAVVRSIMLATLRVIREHGADTFAASIAAKSTK